MAKKIKMLSVELEGDDGLLVTFSDGTIAGYVVEEMLKLRPHREATESSIPANVDWTGNCPSDKTKKRKHDKEERACLA